MLCVPLMCLRIALCDLRDSIGGGMGRRVLASCVVALWFYDFGCCCQINKQKLQDHALPESFLTSFPPPPFPLIAAGLVYCHGAGHCARAPVLRSRDRQGPGGRRLLRLKAAPDEERWCSKVEARRVRVAYERLQRVAVNKCEVSGMAGLLFSIIYSRGEEVTKRVTK